MARPSELLVRAVRDRLVGDPGPMTTERLTSALRESGAVVGSQAAEQVTADLRAELVGAGPLQPLLDDPAVTDVLVNGPRDVWVDRAGQLERVPLDLGNADQVRRLAVRLAASGGQRLDDARPTVDAREVTIRSD